MVKSAQLDSGHRALLNGDETHDHRPHERVRAIRDVQLLKDGRQMVLRGLRADVQPLGDLTVRRTLSQAAAGPRARAASTTTGPTADRQCAAGLEPQEP